MKFSLKEDRTLMLAVKNKETLETEVIAIKGNYEIELFFSNGFCLEGIHHEKLDNNYSMKRAASEINQLKEEIRRLKNEQRRKEKNRMRFSFELSK